jgi:hypothetical protein
MLPVVSVLGALAAAVWPGATVDVLAKDAPKGPRMSLPSYTASADSPVIPDTETGLRIAFPGRAPRAVFAAAEPWALHGAWRVGPATRAEFGAEIEPNLLIVVTHKDSRGIYTGRVLRDDPPPKNVPDSADQGGQVVASSGWFAIDLKLHGRIPPRPGRYWVTVLLGNVASPVLEFEVR